MVAKRVLIIANKAVADRPAGVPEVVRSQVLEAEEVRVVAPMLTSRLQSWVSDIDAAALEADERMQAIVGSIGEAGQAAARGPDRRRRPAPGGGRRSRRLPRGCADPRRACARRRELAERHFSEKVRARFELPVTEMVLDRDGRVISVTSE